MGTHGAWIFKATRLSRLLERKVSQGYKAIKATGGGHRNRSLKATRLSRLLERYVDIGCSRLQGYQGYRRGMLRYVSQGYKAIKATRGGCRDCVFKHTRVSRPCSLDSLVALRDISMCPPPVALIAL